MTNSKRQRLQGPDHGTVVFVGDAAKLTMFQEGSESCVPN